MSQWMGGRTFLAMAQLAEDSQYCNVAAMTGQHANAEFKKVSQERDAYRDALEAILVATKTVPVSTGLAKWLAIPHIAERALEDGRVIKSSQVETIPEGGSK
jgi:hypothetical protein